MNLFFFSADDDNVWYDAVIIVKFWTDTLESPRHLNLPLFNTPNYYYY